jgi:heat shock protein HslJ
MNLRRLLPLAFLATISLAGCEKEDASPTDATLLAHRWQLEQIDSFPLTLSSYSPANNSYLEFVDLGKCTVGLGPCNNFSAHFRLSSTPQQLSITPLITTRAICAAQELETRYFASLARTARYEISGDELRLYDSTTIAPRLVFRKEVK